MSSFPERLKELRKNANLSQKALSESVKMSETGIQNYELKKRKPTAEAVVTLADYFDVSTDYLLGRSDNPTRH